MARRLDTIDTAVSLAEEDHFPGEQHVKFPKSLAVSKHVRSGTAVAIATVIGGCQTTAPVVVVTPQDQAGRLIYTCASGRTLDVTRVQGSASALVVIDGKTIQLPRDGAVTNAERYTNRVQTLTLYGTSATLDILGRSSSGPCTIGSAPAGVPGAVPATPPREGRPDYAD